jgi:putative ABC transport system permease protein
VIGDVHTKGLDRAPSPMIVVPLLQDQTNNLRVGVRARQADPLQLVAPLRAEVAALDKNVALTAPQALARVLTASVAERRFHMILLGVFALMALALAGIGIYGVVAYSVAQRSHEIGIRMALGASSGLVRRMVLGGGLRLAAAGVGFGLVGALAFTRALASLVYKVGTSDPVTLCATGAILMGAAAIASWLPARRATKVDPAVALRAD